MQVNSKRLACRDSECPLSRHRLVHRREAGLLHVETVFAGRQLVEREASVLIRGRLRWRTHGAGPPSRRHYDNPGAGDRRVRPLGSDATGNNAGGGGRSRLADEKGDQETHDQMHVPSAFNAF